MLENSAEEPEENYDAHCFSFQLEEEHLPRGGGGGVHDVVVDVSPKHHHSRGAHAAAASEAEGLANQSDGRFKECAGDAHMVVEIGTSSIVDDVEHRRPAEGGPDVGFEEESFIVASANQHEETMFDDDITSALLNGINSNAVASGAP